MTTHVITYATHSYGNFEELVNNKYGIKVIVLGWGKKWKGFTDKFNAVYKYSKNLPEDDIVIFLDGFDVWINSNLQNVVEKFKKMNSKVIFSKDEEISGRTITKKIFGLCRDGHIVNTGMYIGYAKYIKELMVDTVNFKCRDDQKIINTMCKKYDYINVDHEHILFENCENKKQLKSSQACFTSIPGGGGGTNLQKFKRTYRGWHEYGQFFLYETAIIITILLIICMYYRSYKGFCVVILAGIIFYLSIDKSCM